MTEHYCMKCRTKRTMKGEQEVKVRGRGGERRMLQGVCSVCGTKMVKFLPKEK